MRKCMCICLFLIFVLGIPVQTRAETNYINPITVNGKIGIEVYKYWNKNPKWYYYFEEIEESLLSNDNTKCSSTGKVVHISANYSQTPGFVGKEGVDGDVTIRIYNQKVITPIVDTSVDYKNCAFSTDIDLTELEDGAYLMHFYPNFNCSITCFDLYIYNGKVYFGGGYGVFEKTQYEKYMDSYKMLDKLSPSEILKNYKSSFEAEEYGIEKGGQAYELAQAATVGCVSNYDKARAIYEWIRKNYTTEQNIDDICKMVEAMLSSLGIPTIRTDVGDSCADRWIFIYDGNRWVAFNPYASMCVNSVGYFDSLDTQMCSYAEDIYTYLSKLIPEKGTDLYSTKRKCKLRVVSDLTEEAKVVYLKNKSKSKKVTIPNTITIDGINYKVVKIGNKAFYNNKKITTITIGKNVKSIGKEAFSGCKKLKKITIKSSKLKSVGKNAIKGIDKKATIKVPKKQLSKYKKLFKSKTGYKKTMKIKK